MKKIIFTLIAASLMAAATLLAQYQAGPSVIVDTSETANLFAAAVVETNGAWFPASATTVDLQTRWVTSSGGTNCTIAVYRSLNRTNMGKLFHVQYLVTNAAGTANYFVTNATVGTYGWLKAFATNTGGNITNVTVTATHK